MGKLNDTCEWFSGNKSIVNVHWEIQDKQLYLRQITVYIQWLKKNFPCGFRSEEIVCLFRGRSPQLSAPMILFSSPSSNFTHSFLF